MLPGVARAVIATFRNNVPRCGGLPLASRPMTSDLGGSTGGYLNGPGPVVSHPVAITAAALNPDAWSWRWPVTLRGCAVSAPDALTLHESYGRQLADMLELVRTAEAFSQPVTAQRLSIRLIGVLTRLHEAHQVDKRGRCSICWPHPRRWWRPWPRHALCTVHTTFGDYLPHTQKPTLRRAL